MNYETDKRPEGKKQQHPIVEIVSFIFSIALRMNHEQ